MEMGEKGEDEVDPRRSRLDAGMQTEMFNLKHAVKATVLTRDNALISHHILKSFSPASSSESHYYYLLYRT